MNFQWIQSLQKVVEMGSISRAAKALYISPQALLQQINLLEQELGFKVLDRDNQGSRLTPIGDEFYRGAVKIDEEFNRLIAHCRRASSPERTIRIPFMSSVIAPRFLERTCTEYGQSEDAFSINLIPTAERTNTWINGLLADRYDVIQHFTIESIVPEDVYFEPFDSVATWCVMRKDSPIAHKEVLQPTDMAGRVIAVQALALTRYFQLYLESSNIAARMIEIESDRYSLLHACDNGCIAFVDEAIAHEFPDYHIAPLDFDNHVQSGFACKKDMYEIYEPFFAAARKVHAQPA